MDPEEQLARDVLIRGWLSQEQMASALRRRAELRQAGQPSALLPILQAAAPPFAQQLAALAAQQAAPSGSSPGVPMAPRAPLPAPPAPLPGGHPTPLYPLPPTPYPPAVHTQDTFALPQELARAGAPPTAPAPLRRLGQYDLVREIARGGVGAVYEAVQPSLNRRVAIKVLLDAGSDPEQAERFKREGQAVVRLHHDNIVTVHDFAYEGKTAYLVMELVPGETLKQRVERVGALPLGVAVRYVIKLARAMAYAHSRGVVHRDLKPQNVILDPRDEPRITDFGMARIADLETLTRTGAIMGTPAYMAPEQARGEKSKIDHRVDVYALGVIFYELLTGKPPFRKKTVVAVLDQVLRQEPEPPSSLRAGLDPALEALCLACMVKDPEQRLSTALELAQELDDLSRGWEDEADEAAAAGGGKASLLVAVVIAFCGLAAALWVLLAQR